MENDFDIRTKDDTPQKVSHQIRWSALIISPTLLITIVIFVLSMIPFEKNESGKINIHESINNLIKIFIPNIHTAKIDPVSPKARIAAIKSAIDTYLLNTGQYPAILNDLIIDPNLDRWCGPYVKPSQLSDPWGNPYIYIIDNIKNPVGYTLKSYGADGKSGGKGNNADIFTFTRANTNSKKSIDQFLREMLKNENY